MENMLNLCGLWTRKDKNDNEYYVGKLTYSTRIMVFKNTKKTTEKEPDYYITLCKNEPKLEKTEQEKTDDIF